MTGVRTANVFLSRLHSLNDAVYDEHDRRCKCVNETIAYIADIFVGLLYLYTMLHCIKLRNVHVFAFFPTSADAADLLQASVTRLFACSV